VVVLSLKLIRETEKGIREGRWGGRDRTWFRHHADFVDTSLSERQSKCNVL